MQFLLSLNHHHHWAVLNDVLCKTHAKRSRPTAAIQDSQSIQLELRNRAMI